MIAEGNENLEGYADCKEYLEEQGCEAPVAPVIPTLIEIGLEQGQYPPRLRRGMQFRDEDGIVHTN